jgi:hypothetical protein
MCVEILGLESDNLGSAAKEVQRGSLKKVRMSNFGLQNSFGNEVKSYRRYVSMITIVYNGSIMISIVYGSPAAGSGNKRAASIGGLGR